MQPSMAPRPTARAAWTVRTASRIPPVFASFTFTLWAISAHLGTSAEVMQSSST